MSDITPIEFVRQWISTGALIGLLTLASRLWLQNRKLSMQAKGEDRQGYGTLIDSLSRRLQRQDDRIAELEKGRDSDHKLIIALLGQLNRNQAVAILATQTVSEELRPALEAAMGDAAPRVAQ